jgi:hypothetical protein
MKRCLDDHYRDQQYADQDEYATRGSEMKIKISELTGPALDWAVAECEGNKYSKLTHLLELWEPSTDWAQGGPIIERENIDLAYHGGNGWRAAQVYRHNPATSYGPTPLIAAMRCYVASKLGDEVDVPEELK